MLKGKDVEGIFTTQLLQLGFRSLTGVVNYFRANPSFGHWLIITLLTALLYIVGIGVSDALVTSLTANRITPVWFPAAFTFSLFFYFGDRVIAGIILGSVLGLIHPLSAFEPPLLGWQIFFLQVIFTTANLVHTWLGNIWLKRKLFEVKKSPEEYKSWRKSTCKNIIDPISLINSFDRLKTSLAFITVALFAPMASAFVGIGGLVVLGKIPWDQIAYSWLTWWLGSALAIVVFCPMLMGFEPGSWGFRKRQIPYLVSVISAGILIGLLSFWWAYPVAYLFLPLLLAIVFYFGRFYGSLAVAIIATGSIVLTSLGRGIFITIHPNSSIVYVQIFSGVLSSTTLLFAALIKEKNLAQEMLLQSIDNLEIQVEERTQALLASKIALQESHAELEKLVNLDGLTGIPNRRYFEYRFEMEWQRLAWAGRPLTLMMLDLDCFKTYNDNYGHAQGDVCLREVGQLLQRCLHRPHTDLVARYGGEEFVALLPDVDTAGAIAVAERFLTELRALALPHQFSTVEEIVTISIGIAVTIPLPDCNRQDFFVYADRALHLAKDGGKNQYQFLCLNSCP